jgi:hypothetical protein
MNPLPFSAVAKMNHSIKSFRPTKWISSTMIGLNSITFKTGR